MGCFEMILLIYTGEPRLARELCPKKPRANQNRTNQGSILLYTHQN